MNRFGFFVLFFVMTIYNILAQESGAMVNVQGKDIQSLKHTWAANWITHPTGTTQDFGVYLFRYRGFLFRLCWAVSWCFS